MRFEDLLAAHHDAVQRLAEVPGPGGRFRAADHRGSRRHRSHLPVTEAPRLVDGRLPRERRKRGRELQSPLPQRKPANAARPQSSGQCRCEGEGTIFAVVYRRLVPRLGHAQAIGAIAHRLCRLIWMILHQGIRYEERGPAVSEEARKVRARKMIRELRSLGYRVELLTPPAGNPA
jgi:hypothetical protein